MSDAMTIGGRPVGDDHPPFIIAELSANHGGSLDHALAILDAAAEAGADAVKLQTYTADTMTLNCDAPDFQLTEGPWAGHSLHALYEWAHTPWDWHAALFARGRELGLQVFSTPFDKSAVDFLEQFDPPCYKIASFELVDTPLIEYTARQGRPIIMSTGMGSREEVMEAVLAARRGGCRELCLLHCTSGYPTPPEESDLNTIPAMAARYDVVVGLSDHTLGPVAPIAAVALGARVIEKHFTLSRADGGPDAAFSLEPQELRELVVHANLTHKAIGGIRREGRSSEATQRPIRRSLYAAAPIAKGDVLTEANVRSIRPGHGLPPRDLPVVLGCRAACDIPFGTALDWSLIDRSSLEG